MTIHSRELDKIILRSLKEDDYKKDVTTNLLVSPKAQTKAYILAKEYCVVSGLPIVKAVLKKLDKRAIIKFLVKEGAVARPNQKIVSIKSKARALLTGERTALNFLGRLSGIATLTRSFVKKTRPFSAKIYDTRKTTPGLRMLEKYAVVCGGGQNHRFSLSELMLIKDNHRRCYKDISDLVDELKHIRRKTKKEIEVEVDTLDQFKKVLSTAPDLILLDNMNPQTIRQAVKILKGKKNRPILEVSGGITLKNVRAFAGTGVERISIGALTHSAHSINFSMEVV